jgi:hypothetical protein
MPFPVDRGRPVPPPAIPGPDRPWEPPAIDPDSWFPPDVGSMPPDTWNPGYSPREAARERLETVNRRIDRDLQGLRQAIALRERENTGLFSIFDGTLSQLRRAESALESARDDADRALRALRGREDWRGNRGYYDDGEADRRIGDLMDHLSRADEALSAARANRSPYFYRDGSPQDGRPNPRAPRNPGGSDSGRPMPPDIGSPGTDRRPLPPDIGSPGTDRRPRNPGGYDPGRPVPPSPRDPGGFDPGRPNPRPPRDPVDPTPFPTPRPRPPIGDPWPRDPRNPLDPRPPIFDPWPRDPRLPIYDDRLTRLLDTLRSDVRQAWQEAQEARNFLRRSSDPWQDPRPVPPPVWNSHPDTWFDELKVMGLKLG